MMNQTALSTTRATKTTWVLLGNVLLPLNKAGCQAKKRTDGTIRAGIPKIKLGITIRAGKGAHTVGTPVWKVPRNARTSRAIPESSVTGAGFMLEQTENFELKAESYLRAKRSKSAIWRSISSRAASEAERMPWMRSLNSSALDARARASSRVMSCLV